MNGSIRTLEVVRLVGGVVVAGVLAASLPAWAEVEPAPVQAQPGPAQPASPDSALHFTAGTKGLSFGLPSGGGGAVGGAWFLTPDAALRVDVALLLGLAPTVSVGASVNVGFRVYQPALGRLRTYVQPNLRVALADGSVGLGASGAFGVEYFLLDRFSVSGDVGLGLRLDGLGGTVGPVIKLETGTSSLLANFYF